MKNNEQLLTLSQMCTLSFSCKISGNVNQAPNVDRKQTPVCKIKCVKINKPKIVWTHFLRNVIISVEIVNRR